MKKYYALITLSNNDAGKELVEGQNERQLLCTWTENFLDEWVSISTNTFCEKKLVELVTGEKIYPTTEEDGIKMFSPGVLKYDEIPKLHKISYEEAMRLLEVLKRDKEYVNFIYKMKNLVKQNRREDIRQKIKKI